MEKQSAVDRRCMPAKSGGSVLPRDSRASERLLRELAACIETSGSDFVFTIVPQIRERAHSSHTHARGQETDDSDDRRSSLMAVTSLAD